MAGTSRSLERPPNLGNWPINTDFGSYCLLGSLQVAVLHHKSFFFRNTFLWYMVPLFYLVWASFTGTSHTIDLEKKRPMFSGWSCVLLVLMTADSPIAVMILLWIVLLSRLFRHCNQKTAKRKRTPIPVAPLLRSKVFPSQYFPATEKHLSDSDSTNRPFRSKNLLHGPPVVASAAYARIRMKG